jgi:F-type H+-transporting ATPase subunit delta
LAGKILQAKRYSQAIFEIAKERNEFDEWQRDLQQIAILAQNHELLLIMENPQFPVAEKFKLLNTQLKNLSPLALNLACILTGNGKFYLITDIYAEYRKRLDSYRGIEQAEVTTAVPLDENERQKLAERLGEITRKKIIMTARVDPGIIGGVIARVGEVIIDGSTRSQLAALKNEIAGAGG